MYFWFEWEISFIQDFKETSISPSPRDAKCTQLIYPTTFVLNAVWICVQLQVTRSMRSQLSAPGVNELGGAALNVHQPGD